MKRKPIIITGHARSGTTALCDLLNIDGRLFITNETWSFIPEIEDAQSIYINLQWTGTIHRMVDLFEKHGLSWADLMPFNIRRSMFNDWLDSNLPDTVEYIGDKTPRPYLQDQVIQKILTRSGPDLKIIIAMRDGRDSVISPFWGQRAWPNTDKFHDPSGKIIDTGRNQIVESWIYYVGVIKNYLLEHHASKCLVVKYEDACDDPQKTVEKISEFLELDSCLNIEGHNYRPVNKNSWRLKYPNITKSIDKVYPEFKQLLEFFGYE